MKRLIIVGSPRTNGRSAHLAEMLFEANIDEHPEDELFLVPLSEVEVGPCIGCNACREKMPVILKGDDGGEVTVERNRCVFDDDMQSLYDLIDDADEVTVVSPVYFSGAPAQLKCLLDRLQPYFWAHGGKYPAGKRPAVLHVIGEGGDPHGYKPLVGEVTSALAVAGFRLERVLDWVGKIDERGEIVAEAKEARFDEEGKKERPKLNVTSASGKAGKGKAAEAAQGGQAARAAQDGQAAKVGRGAQASKASKAPKAQKTPKAQKARPPRGKSAQGGRKGKGRG